MPLSRLFFIEPIQVLYHSTLPFGTCRALRAIKIITNRIFNIGSRPSAQAKCTADKIQMLQFKIISEEQIWSGRRDSNPRPLEPHSSALPSCATARRQRGAKMRCERRFFKQEKHSAPKQLSKDETQRTGSSLVREQPPVLDDNGVVRCKSWSPPVSVYFLAFVDSASFRRSFSFGVLADDSSNAANYCGS